MHIGEESGDDITLATHLIFEWQHVRRLGGEPYLVRICYRNQISHGRTVPNCSLRLKGHPCFVYIVAFFEAFAANISLGLQ